MITTSGWTGLDLGYFLGVGGRWSGHIVSTHSMSGADGNAGRPLGWVAVWRREHGDEDGLIFIGSTEYSRVGPIFVQFCSQLCQKPGNGCRVVEVCNNNRIYHQ